MADNEAPHAHDLATDEAKTRGCGVGRQMPRTLPYDLLKDFEPVALVEFHPLVIAAKRALPAKDLKELIRVA
jgi:tripartite-type tricarboxylate transporter receptor subunit TctC